jgi:hypothetical protein
MSAEWQSPDDPAEFAAWMDNFVEKLPKCAKQFGITPKMIKALH